MSGSLSRGKVLNHGRSSMKVVLRPYRPSRDGNFVKIAALAPRSGNPRARVTVSLDRERVIWDLNCREDFLDLRCRGAALVTVGRASPELYAAHLSTSGLSEEELFSTSISIAVRTGGYFGELRFEMAGPAPGFNVPRSECSDLGVLLGGCPVLSLRVKTLDLAEAGDRVLEYARRAVDEYRMEE